MKTTRPVALPKLAVPKFAQLSGMIVATIVVLGIDADALWAVPMGIVAGAVATFFMSLSGHRDAASRL